MLRPTPTVTTARPLASAGTGLHALRFGEAQPIEFTGIAVDGQGIDPGRDAAIDDRRQPRRDDGIRRVEGRDQDAGDARKGGAKLCGGHAGRFRFGLGCGGDGHPPWRLAVSAGRHRPGGTHAPQDAPSNAQPPLVRGPRPARLRPPLAHLRRWATTARTTRGKPVIGILNTWSDINPCHAHFRDRAEEVKRGVWQAGGFPLELPAISLSETFKKPTTMLYRNLLAMETEELLRAVPDRRRVLLGGCDKTTPALVMGAISAELPAIFVPAGPMLRGNWHGKTLGSGSDVWKYWAELRAGNISRAPLEGDRRAASPARSAPA